MTDLFSKFDPLIELRTNLLAHGQEDPFNLVMERVISPTEAVCNGRPTILLGTYNYMGMTFDPDVIEAGKQALDDFGSGTTGSRVLNGTYAGHRAVEDALKEFYGMDHAMVFSTGYQANLGIISTVAGKGDYIVLDIDSHASIWDGCKMGDAEVVPFKHNDIEAMEKRLKRIPEGAGKLVVLEGVYSMLGDIAPLKEMIRVAKDNGAMVLVDEAHSMGFIGPNGRGVAEDQGVLDQVDFVIGTFSKSVGTVGGFCVSNHPKFEILRLVCRPYVFTASLPPSVVHTASTSIRKLMHAGNKRAHLWENSRVLHQGLRDKGFQLGTEKAESAIIAVIMPDLEKGAAMWEALLKEGLYVNLARPPATPANMTLLRCSLCAEHTAEQVQTIIGMFERAGKAVGII
ncbi:aminotransferase class I/II-fold pyridoxal phosphate-dependent enzyme [Novosphingobium sp.]|jgi:glycine C-acetyltransferase/8-amino-7-oxononanoate synthase|uniref:serine palmitoyltransferase n=1 Tax=Novosphingobium sp. TaxID=1874826 RepID=UPI0022CD1C2E|nr:aminotransferase class I/II-fold pyridoxal phosphate-dependent enzyme [Novosphingobium sp.]MCZ8018801.1 aminotransferase class I/II-fold pyridoxal phosphate-dependent enzyme [Novosphingobium sp.]MCZ8034806.1 aminotransferase class I/II-fold pyridoxal phosphate-dependent enzyme [Novosphingobium sp.]MCZ8052941.1 aminotransferase class I/II-fold pyridoxal phosphate-dependent enzyme [Novosphingobium sp.]MCZ8060699.1 aminotransferase class I/II-fold pyridoxal phosphate-dependent enzyme [Novosphin